MQRLSQHNHKARPAFNHVSTLSKNHMRNKAFYCHEAQWDAQGNHLLEVSFKYRYSPVFQVRGCEGHGLGRLGICSPPLHPASSPRPSAPEDPRRVCLDLPQHLPEVRRRGQGIVGVPFSVLVSAIQRPGSVGLAVPNPGDI